MRNYETNEKTRNKRKLKRLLLFSFFSFYFVCFVVTSVQSCQLIKYEDTRVSMASAYTIVVYGRAEQNLPVIVNDAFDEVDRIDRLMSNYKPESPLSRINREAGDAPVAVEPELFEFIAECLRYSRASDGGFDVTVGPLMKAWGFFRGEGRMPARAELNSARVKIGYRHLILNDRKKTIQFDRPGVELDLGGIAKGYAVDRVIRLLKERGIERALVSAGGSTIYGLGAPPDSDGWEVEIQDPVDHMKSAASVLLKDRALSVSGSYEKFFEIDGARFSHIMDPRTGRPVQRMLSVAVITDTGTAGDALDNVFYVNGVDWSKKHLSKFTASEVFFFLPAGEKRWKMIKLKKEIAKHAK